MATLTDGIVQLRGSGIFISNSLDDNGERIWTLGVGGNGINASLLNVGVLNADNVNIYSGDHQRFKWFGDGLFAYDQNDNLSPNFNKWVRFNEDGLCFREPVGESYVDRVSLDWEGLTIRDIANNKVLWTDGSGNLTLTGSMQSADFTDGANGKGWQIDRNGNATFNNARIRGILSSVIFEKTTIAAVGGSLYVTPTLSAINGTIFSIDGTNIVFNIASTLGSSGGRTWVVNDQVLFSGKIYESSGTTRIFTINSAKGTVSIIGAGYYRITVPVANILDIIPTEITTSSLLKEATFSFLISATNGRQGIYLTAEENNAPFLDVYNNVAAGNPEVRLGNLAGITNALFNGGTALSGYGLYAQKVYLTGEIVASAGSIGGFRISANSIYYDDTYDSVGLKATTSSSDYAFWAGQTDSTRANSRFWVRGDGYIRSIAGTIGGWTISATTLAGNSGAIGLSSASSGTLIWAGGAQATAPFRVGADGSVYSSLLEVEYQDNYTVNSTSSTPPSIGSLTVGYIWKNTATSPDETLIWKGTSLTSNRSYTSGLLSGAGKNLLPFLLSRTISGVNFMVQDNGSMLVTGTASAAINTTFLGTYGSTTALFWLPPGTYRLTQTNPAVEIRMGYASTTIFTGASPTQTFTVPTAISWVHLLVSSGAVLNTTIYPQLEIGSSVTTYEQYRQNIGMFLADSAYAQDLACSIKFLSTQAGSGAPSPTNIRSLSGIIPMSYEFPITQLGKNLVYNSCLLEDTLSWGLGTNVTRDTSVKYNGNISFKNTQSGLVADSYRGGSASPATEYSIPCKVGETFTASIYFFVENYLTFEGSTLHVALDFKDSAGTNIESFYTAVVPTISHNGTWTRLVRTGTGTNANIRYASLRFFITRNGTAWFAAPQLEKSASVTDYEGSQLITYNIPFSGGVIDGEPGFESEINFNTKQEICRTVLYTDLYSQTGVWTLNATYTANGYYTFYSDGLPAIPPYNYYPKCSHIASLNPNVTTATYGIEITTDGRISIRVPGSIATTASAFTLWLEANAVEVLCRLATPEIYEANFLPKIKLRSGANYFKMGYNGNLSFNYTGSGWTPYLGSQKVIMSPEEGLKINMKWVSNTGENFTDTYFSAKNSKFGLFRSADDVMIAGAGVLPNGKGYFSSSILKDDIVSSDFYLEMISKDPVFEDSSTSFGFALKENDFSFLEITGSYYPGLGGIDKVYRAEIDAKDNELYIHSGEGGDITNLFMNFNPKDGGIIEIFASSEDPDPLYSGSSSLQITPSSILLYCSDFMLETVAVGTYTFSRTTWSADTNYSYAVSFNLGTSKVPQIVIPYIIRTTASGLDAYSFCTSDYTTEGFTLNTSRNAARSASTTFTVGYFAFAAMGDW